MAQTFRHSGDLGDVIAALPAIRQLGGGKIILCDSFSSVPGLTARESLRGTRFNALRPLLLAQPYITGVEWSDDIKHTTHDAWKFRNQLRRGESLAHAQARHLGISDLSLSQWLYVPEVLHSGRIVIARSERYHNDLWVHVWPQIGKTYHDRLLFVGLKKEHKALEEVMGRKIQMAKTPNLLAAARIIAGSQLCITNQSCPAWIAMGLNHRYIQETDDERPNSVIKYPKAYFAGNRGEVDVLLTSLRRFTL